MAGYAPAATWARICASRASARSSSSAATRYFRPAAAQYQYALAAS